MAVDYIAQLKQIAYSYPDGTKAIDAISLDILRGGRIAFLGNNGAGKSTLFLLLNGILKPASGEYLFDGKLVDYKRKSLFELRKSVGVVFQEPDNQLFAPTVYEELSFGPMNLGMPEDEVRARIEQVMQVLDIEKHKNKPPHLISYGQKKQVAIGSLLTMKPAMLVLDEPTSGLDGEHTEQMVQVLDKLHQAGTTILLSTHDVNFAFEWADTIVLMNNGKIETVGTAAEVFLNEAALEKCGLKLPAILQVYNMIAHRCEGGKLPKTVAQLNKIISDL
jgi:cobalt/nickel transport system ATP-binding protein